MTDGYYFSWEGSFSCKFPNDVTFRWNVQRDAQSKDFDAVVGYVTLPSFNRVQRSHFALLQLGIKRLS
jgi:hypothetical protein